MPDRVGKRIAGRYELRRVISAGRLSVLYEARHCYTERSVAIQLLTAAGRAEGELGPRLLEEAQARSRARHPFVVAVLDAGEEGPDDPHLVAETPDGRTLDGLLASRGKLEPADALALGLHVAEALACAHARGVIHGSLGPASILLPSPTMDPWLIESGEPLPAAKLLDLGRAAHPTDEALVGSLGGFGYTPSEQLHGSPPDALVDVYALGAVLYECLSGHLPPADGVRPALGAVLRRAATPAPLAEVVLGALAARAERLRSMMELLGALRRIATLEPPPKSEPPPRRRRTPRASYVAPVQLARRGQPRTQWLCQDISEGGLLVVGSPGLEPGEQVTIRFALPRCGQETTLTAMVRWTRPARDDKAAAGLEFVGAPAATRDDIREYVSFFSRFDE